MKKLFVIFILTALSTFSVTAQTSLPLQYFELAKKLITPTPKNDLVKVNTSSVNAPASSSTLIDFAKTMLGIPYRYATSNPKVGFDCSGFVSYVFNNLGFKVPRSSREFPSVGKETNLENAKVGDVLIFTGTNPRVRKVGHVAIIYSIDADGIKFIHSTSGKEHGVTITPFNDYYKSRFMKVVSII
ncbi:NlpC/P60 family protein [Pedobacter changchengzhani]|uniref:NlpC/P60 family protein n=1 Tax=Pedobacter changchengzhani TaxID=2529274 RepID=A0A4R5MIN0_9SPHI|nr:C40 family peptidase [Pedobacter changchengzhani]TDG34889.1 NlpC/P60 family protein [Pedobacter changchengzhani]